MTIGLLGTGRQGRKYIETCGKMGLPLLWTSNTPRFDADNIIIATPAETHYDLARKAMRQGRNVLIEKPMVMDLQEAETLYDLAVQMNVTGFVGHTHLYSKAWREIKAKAKDVIAMAAVCGGPCDGDPKWEWGTHPAAMALDISPEIKNTNFIVSQNEKIPFRFVVMCRDDAFVYADPPTDPRPMEVMVREFLDAKNDPSGIKMGLEVTRALCA